jgi:hypothetical protein
MTAPTLRDVIKWAKQACFAPSASTKEVVSSLYDVVELHKFATVVWDAAQLIL